MPTTAPQKPSPMRRAFNTIKRQPPPPGATHKPSESRPSQQPYIPQQITDGWIHYFHDQVIDDHIKRLTNLLIHVRQLPNFYFRRALVEEKLPPATAAQWDPRRWVSPKGRINIKEYDRKILALTALIKVERNLTNEPENETYHQAMIRFQHKLQELIDQKLSRAEIARRLKINPKTIASVLDDKHADQARICPWDSMRRIAATNWEPTPRNQRRPLRNIEPPTRYSLSDHEVSRSRARDKAANRQANVTRVNFIQYGQPCHKCNAGFNHLKLEAVSPDGAAEFTCRICGSSNYSIINSPSETPHQKSDTHALHGVLT